MREEGRDGKRGGSFCHEKTGSLYTTLEFPFWDDDVSHYVSMAVEWLICFSHISCVAGMLTEQMYWRLCWNTSQPLLTEHGCTETSSSAPAYWATELRAVLKQLLQPLMTEQTSCMWFFTPHMWFFAPQVCFLNPCMWFLTPQAYQSCWLLTQICHTDLSSYSTWPNHAESSTIGFPTFPFLFSLIY